ncbi:MAG: hypothetical protein RQ760_19485, partial [Sedimentisphaerales bacterium]|nr:hypothetical protein [Sedimentisphaerales bacterium]
QKNKNKIFPKFLSSYPVSSYKIPASKIETFFGSILHTHLIIEGAFFYPHGYNMKYGIRGMKHPIFNTLYAVISSTTVENVRQITPFYAKQSQFDGGQNEHNSYYNNEICNIEHLADRKKTNPIQSQFNPKQTQNKANKAKNKPNSKPICSQFSVFLLDSRPQKTKMQSALYKRKKHGTQAK